MPASATPPLEDVIRDYFVNHLTLIEPGLTLRKKEHTIPNANGADGRVDILARDRADHVVVIEVKRSNRSSRETVQELHKYVYLLQQTEGLAPEEIRCIVLSTDWDELLAPFSLFVHETGFSTLGFKILINTPEFTLEAISPLPIPRANELQPKLEAYFFRTPEIRNIAIYLLNKRTLLTPGVSGVIVELNYKGPDERVTSPHAFACGLWRLPVSQRGVLAVNPGICFGELDPYIPADWADETDVSHWLLKDVRAMLRSDSTIDLAVLTRTGLRGLLGIGWRPGAIQRFGKAGPSRAARQDDELIRTLSARTDVEYDVRMDSRIRSSWSERQRAFLDRLAFAPAWLRAAESFFLSLEDGSRECFVNAYLRETRYLPYALAQVAQGVKPQAAFPFFRIMAEFADGPSRSARLLRGGLTWDGETCPGSAARMLTEVFGDELLYPLALHAGWWKPQYLSAYKLHGMTFDCELATLRSESDGTWTEVAPPQRLPSGPIRWAPEEFVRTNREYCDELVRLGQQLIAFL